MNVRSTKLSVNGSVHVIKVSVIIKFSSTSKTFCGITFVHIKSLIIKNLIAESLNRTLKIPQLGANQQQCINLPI